MEYKEQVEEYIYKLCESNNFNIDKNEFDIEICSECMTKTINNIVYKDQYIVSNKFILKEKNGNFSISIIGNADPMYIAYYAVKKYVERRDKYLKEKQEECKREHLAKKKYSLLDGLFDN